MTDHPNLQYLTSTPRKRRKTEDDNEEEEEQDEDVFYGSEGDDYDYPSDYTVIRTTDFDPDSIDTDQVAIIMNKYCTQIFMDFIKARKFTRVLTHRDTQTEVVPVKTINTQTDITNNQQEKQYEDILHKKEQTIIELSDKIKIIQNQLTNTEKELLSTVQKLKHFEKDNTEPTELLEEMEQFMQNFSLETRQQVTTDHPHMDTQDVNTHIPSKHITHPSLSPTNKNKTHNLHKEYEIQVEKLEETQNLFLQEYSDFKTEMQDNLMKFSTDELRKNFENHKDYQDFIFLRKVLNNTYRQNQNLQHNILLYKNGLNIKLMDSSLDFKNMNIGKTTQTEILQEYRQFLQYLNEKLFTEYINKQTQQLRSLYNDLDSKYTEKVLAKAYRTTVLKFKELNDNLINKKVALSVRNLHPQNKQKIIDFVPLDHMTTQTIPKQIQIHNRQPLLPAPTLNTQLHTLKTPLLPTPTLNPTTNTQQNSYIQSSLPTPNPNPTSNLQMNNHTFTRNVYDHIQQPTFNTHSFYHSNHYQNDYPTTSLEHKISKTYFRSNIQNPPNTTTRHNLN